MFYSIPGTFILSVIVKESSQAVWWPLGPAHTTPGGDGPHGVGLQARAFRRSNKHALESEVNRYP